MIWQPLELFASSFIVSATTFEFGFTSLCRRASTADSTKFRNNFLEYIEQTDESFYKLAQVANKTKAKEL